MVVANTCPYNVAEKITSFDIQNICDAFDIPIITDAELFAADLNLYYEGYKQHKRTHSSERNIFHASVKQRQEQFDKVNNAARKLANALKDFQNYKDGVMRFELNSRLYLSKRRDEGEIENIEGIAKILEVLDSETRIKINQDSGIDFSLSSQQWFFVFVIPKLYNKHTGLKHARSYSPSKNSSGKPHKFSMAVLKYFDDFAKTSDSGFDSALAKSRELKNDYEWPYEWIVYHEAD